MYIGIDLGTSAVKLLLMNPEGKVLKTVSKEYPLLFPKENWIEQNPDDWWDRRWRGVNGYSSTPAGCGSIPRKNF